MKTKRSRLIIFMALSVLLSICSALFLGHAVANNIERPDLVVELSFAFFAAGVLLSVGMARGKGYAYSSIDISALNTALGAYFRKSKDILISEMLLGFNPQDTFEVYDDVKDELALPNLSTSDLIKPANDVTFSSSSNALAFGARVLKVRRWKVDLLIVPGLLEKSWLGAYKQKGSNAYDLPFEGYIMQYICDRIHENLRMKAVYTGVYDGSGTNPEDVMDGIDTLIAAERTAGNLTAISTGTITSSNIIDKLLLVHDGLSEAYKNAETQMPLSPTLFDYAVRKFNPVLNSSLISTDIQAMQKGGFMNQFILPGTNCVLKREPGRGSSQMVYAMPKTNMVYGTDTFGEENNIKSQEFERTIKLMIDAKSGVQLKQVNDNVIAVNEGT